MARPPLVLARETLRLIHPADSAIDLDATPPDVLLAYAECRDLDVKNLLLTEDAPTWYEVRALTDHERWTAQGLLGGIDADDNAERVLAFSEYMLWVVSVCLVSVENLEGWDASARVKSHGVQSWDLAQVRALGTDIVWLYKAIEACSTLAAEKKRPSGS